MHTYLAYGAVAAGVVEERQGFFCSKIFLFGLKTRVDPAATGMELGDDGVDQRVEVVRGSELGSDITAGERERESK